MIFPLKRNFRDKIFEVSQDLSRGACEGPKFSRLKFLRPDKNPQNPRKFSSSKILGYTVIMQEHQSLTYSYVHTVVSIEERIIGIFLSSGLLLQMLVSNSIS